MVKKRLINIIIICSVIAIISVTFVSITRVMNVIEENKKKIDTAYSTAVASLFDTVDISHDGRISPEDVRQLREVGDTLVSTITEIHSMQFWDSFHLHYPEIGDILRELENARAAFRDTLARVDINEPAETERISRILIQQQRELVDLLSRLNALLVPYMRQQEYFYRLLYIFYLGGIIIVGLIMINQNRSLRYERLHGKEIRELTDKIIESQELERQRIALDLHDTIAQELTTLMLSVETMVDGVEGEVSDEFRKNVRKRVKQISGETKEILIHVRQISYDLRPPVLSELGFEKALYGMYDNFSARTGIDCYFTSSESKRFVLSEKQKINLYRAVQEILQNIEKHSKAKRVYFDLQYTQPNLLLIVQDDGIGFQREKINGNRSSHMGLRGIEERVRLCNGTVSIQSRRDKGTIVSIEVPAEGMEGRNR